MKKIKHDHKGTKLLKLGIFASLMLAPLLAIGFKCAYVTFNKNAKDSYSDSFIQQSVEITNDQSYQIGANYQVNYVADTGTSYTNKIYFSKLSFDPVDYGFSNAYNYTFFRVRADSYMYLGDDVNTQQAQQVWGRTITSFTYTSNATPSGSNAWTNGSARFYLLTYKQDTLDNAFYYAVDEMKNNELFNWTTNTALYTPTATMTNGMGITTNALPILITYWLYLTAIYIVIDIVVELFTALTHMITSRFEQ